MINKAIDKIKALINVGVSTRNSDEKLFYMNEKLNEINEKLQFIDESINNRLHQIQYNDPRHPQYLFYKVCEHYQEQTVQFIVEHMKKAICITDYEEYMRFALENTSVQGDVLEFGVFSGYTINYMSSQRPEMTFYGFDSFEGLPESWSGYHSFDFDVQGKMPEVNENVTLVKGWYDESLPKFLETFSEKCSLLHIDCDLYSSTKTVFENIAPYITEGTIIMFDEFFNYPNYEEHEMKAFFEFVEKNKIEFEYLAYCGERVMIKIIKSATG